MQSFWEWSWGTGKSTSLDPFHYWSPACLKYNAAIVLHPSCQKKSNETGLLQRINCSHWGIGSVRQYFNVTQTQMMLMYAHKLLTIMEEWGTQVKQWCIQLFIIPILLVTPWVTFGFEGSCVLLSKYFTQFWGKPWYIQQVSQNLFWHVLLPWLGPWVQLGPGVLAIFLTFLL